MDKVNVLIVDDSAFMRKFIQDLLSQNQAIQVVGTARNGEDAIKKIKSLQPDVVTMDIEMPKMDGIAALKIIMEKHPVPVVMLSSTTQEGAENTLLAMQYGAVDFIAKPSGSISLDLHKVKDELINKVLLASRVQINQLVKMLDREKTTTPLDGKYSKIDIHNKVNHLVINGHSFKKKIVCIGTSTGGPRALQCVLTKLPSEIQAPILIVQHMPAGFTKSLANRLNTLCHVTVKEAEDGDLLKNGYAYIAPGGYHLTVKKVGSSLAIHLDESSPRNGHRPSVDVMFESISQIQDYAKIAVIMTGMGSDGAKGLSKMKKTGIVKAIAESEESAIVFGMPKAAIQTNLVDEVHNVENIAEAILKYV